MSKEGITGAIQAPDSAELVDAICTACLRRYSPDPGPLDHYLGPPYWYSRGADRFCLLCWLGVGPNDHRVNDATS